MNILAWRKWAIVWMVAVLSGFQLRAADPVVAPVNMEPLTIEGNRFVTLCIMIRTTPWEVSRDVKLHPRDEVDWHTLEGVRALREAFATNNPNGRLTWGFTMNALEDGRKNYREIRDYVVECQKKYGDEVTYFPGYFPAMYLPRERVNREMSEAIEIISKMVGNGYRPQSIMGGFLSADNLRYLAEKENITVQPIYLVSQENGGSVTDVPDEVSSCRDTAMFLTDGWDRSKFSETAEALCMDLGFFHEEEETDDAGDQDAVWF